jgi:hypothetical protein
MIPVALAEPPDADVYIELAATRYGISLVPPEYLEMVAGRSASRVPSQLLPIRRRLVLIIDCSADLLSHWILEVKSSCRQFLAAFDPNVWSIAVLACGASVISLPSNDWHEQQLRAVEMLAWTPGPAALTDALRTARGMALSWGYEPPSTVLLVSGTHAGRKALLAAREGFAGDGIEFAIIHPRLSANGEAMTWRPHWQPIAAALDLVGWLAVQ